MKALLISETNSWDRPYGHSARKVLELLGATDNRHHFTEKKEDKRKISILFYKRITYFHYIHLFNGREIRRVLYPQLLTKMKI